MGMKSTRNKPNWLTAFLIVSCRLPVESIEETPRPYLLKRQKPHENSQCLRKKPERLTMRLRSWFLLGILLSACSSQSQYDVVLRNGTIYDGSGKPGNPGDVAILGDKIAATGVVTGKGREEIDVRGLAVAPGFINMLSWA